MAGVNMPSSYGGLMRYNEEYKSKFIIDPKYVIALIIIAIIGVVALKILFPITASA